MSKTSPSPTISKELLRSFGRVRARKLGDEQALLMQTLFPDVKVTLEDKALLARLAGHGRLQIEIGFGGGEHLAACAGAQNDVAFIGCEPFTNGVASLLQHISRENIKNINVFHGDARLLLDALPASIIERAYVLFPDPWPKVRQHKKRLVSPPLLERLARVMKPAAQLVVATDHVDYAEWIFKHLQEDKNFSDSGTSGEGHDIPPSSWVETRYQHKARKEGREAKFFVYNRA